MQLDQLKRREFITLIGGSAAAWPRAYALVLLAITASWPAPIEAHDIYTTLKNRFGGSCCSEHDCRPAHYRITAARVQMLVNGEWIVVPDETIQYRTLEGDTGETAEGHWCGTLQTHCAILPPSSASSTQHERVRGKNRPCRCTQTDEVIE